MIRLQGKLKRDVYVACSGGVDSMAAVDFLRKNHNVKILFFDHQTETSAEAKEFLSDYVSDSNKQFRDTPTGTKLEMQIGNIKTSKLNTDSWEEYWRNERYGFFHGYDEPVITCHHLDDCVETWVWSSMHGTGKIIPYSNKNVIRPFRLNRKFEFTNWCRRNSVSWIEDKSNDDSKYMRNYIRNEIISKLLVINPGLHKVIAKKVTKEFENE